jgi:hypothetical protein
MKLNKRVTAGGYLWEVQDAEEGDGGEGHFTVYMQFNASKTVDFLNNVASVGIHVRETERGKGKAREYMAYFLTKVCRGLNGYVYVDADASAGFWKHAGFASNPDAEDATKAHYGYELRASLADLRLFCKIK